MTDKQPTTKVRFTEAWIRKLKPGPTRQFYADSTTRGFQLLVYESGVKSFLLYRWVQGRPEKMFIGRWPDLSVLDARKIAERMNGEIARNKNPAEEQRQKKLEGSLQQLFDRYLELHAIPNKRPSSVLEDRGVWRRYFEQGWGSKRLSMITRRDVETLKARLKDEHGIFAANRALALMSSMMVKAIHWGWAGPNPCSGVSKFNEKPYARKRIIEEGEMPLFWAALYAQPDRDFEDFIKLSLFCGARSGNTLAMRFDEIDFAKKTWTIPLTKGGEPQEIELVPPALDILTRRREAAGSNGHGWVFASPKTTGHVSSFREPWDALMKATGFVNLRPHDLRRTHASWMLKIGASLAEVKERMGHHTLAATEVYARAERLDIRRKAEAGVAKMLGPGTE